MKKNIAQEKSEMATPVKNEPIMEAETNNNVKSEQPMTETPQKRKRGRPKGSINPDSKHQQMLRRRAAKRERENMLD